MGDRYDSNLSRRALLRGGIVAGGLIAGGGLVYLGWDGLLRPKTTTLRVTAPSSYDLAGRDWREVLGSTGLELKFSDNGNDVGPVLTRMISGTMANEFDVQGLQGGAEPELARAGKILPWDVGQIPNWSQIWPEAKDISYAVVNGARYGLPLALNADSIIYLPDKIKQISGYESGVVDSYSAVFDSRLAGRTSMEDAWINSAIFTAIFLKDQGVSIVDPGNLTSAELKEVMTFLIDKKRAGQFRRFWKGWEQGVQLLRSGQVIAMTGWEPIVKALNKQGMNAKYAVPKEGYEGWANMLLLHSGAEKRGLVKQAHHFADALYAGYYGCALLKQRGYVVPSQTTLPFARKSPLFDASEIASGLTNVEDKLNKHKVFWQNVRPNEYRLYDEWWEKLRGA